MLSAPPTEIGLVHAFANGISTQHDMADDIYSSMP